MYAYKYNSTMYNIYFIDIVVYLNIDLLFVSFIIIITILSI